MGSLTHPTEQVRRPVQDEGRTPPILAVCSNMGEVAWTHTLGEVCWADLGRLPRRSPCGGVYLSDCLPDTK